VLTEKDKQLIADTGMVPPGRLNALTHALRSLGADAGLAAAEHADGPKSHAAAALRGKRAAYFEASRMVQQILDGRALHPRSYSTDRKRAQEYAARRAASKDGANHYCADHTGGCECPRPALRPFLRLALEDVANSTRVDD
jgi:hypothetical protein